MSQASPDPASWVLTAVDALNRHGSWTGRVHVHKHLFITQVLGLAAPPFEFVLYDYGPYSFDLDDKIIELELLGHLSRSYPQPGYGPRYEPTLQGLELARTLRPEDRTAVEGVARQLRDRKSQELELIATCLWVERKDGISDPTRVVSRVQVVKPKYDEETVRRSLSDARALAESLAREAGSSSQ
ncbi:MAG TPA: hypothetical protein VM487_22860 [Phycisphaerae bacterium]|nr:hypothetical protein [Phycisphaerae bacterium]